MTLCDPKKEVVRENMVRVNCQYHKIRQWCVKKYRLWIINWNYIFIIKPISNEGRGKFPDEFILTSSQLMPYEKQAHTHRNKINIQFRTIIHWIGKCSSNIFRWKFVLDGLFVDVQLVNFTSRRDIWRYSNYRVCKENQFVSVLETQR